MKNKSSSFRNNVKVNNKGVALISVMVIATVCLLVATIVLQLTYTSLLSRKVGRASSSNFYATETAVDNLETVLQSIAAYTTEKMGDVSDAEFIDLAESTLYASAGIDVSASEVEKNNAVSQYLFGELDEEYQQYLAKKDADGEYVLDGTGGYVLDTDKFKVTAIKKKEGSGSAIKSRLVLSVDLKYENKNGYLTDISTDFVMNDVTSRKPATEYSLGSYSMFTGGGATFNGNDVSGKTLNAFFQEGNAYIGTKKDSKTALDIHNTSVIFEGERVIINGDVHLTGKAALFFTGDIYRKDGENEVLIKKYSPVVNIRGTLYIGDSAALVISEGTNLLVQDIVLVDSEENKEYSVFEGGTDDGNSYLKYAGGGVTYPAMFPYNTSKKFDVKGSANTGGMVHDDFENKKTSGCIIYRGSSGAYVVNYNKDEKKWRLEGTSDPLGATINQDPYFAPVAKTSVWTYDNKEISVDLELARFINVPVLYWQSQIPSDTMTREEARYINMGGATSKKTLDTGYGGAPLEVFTVDNGAGNSKLSGASVTGKGTAKTTVRSFVCSKMDINNPEFWFSSGNYAEPVNPPGNALVMYLTYNNYEIHLSSQKAVGMFVSADSCYYFNDGKGVAVCYSLQATKEYDPDAYQSLCNIIKNDLKYITFETDAAMDKAKNYFKNDDMFEYGYATCSIDSTFIQGIEEALTGDGSGDENLGGEVDVDISNMYDFISVENWESN